MASILAELRPMIPVVGRDAVTGTRVRVLLIERAPLLRNALAELIGQWNGISITSLASSAERLHCQDDALPDVIVIDADNNPGSVLPLLKRVRDENLSSRVIILMQQSCRESTEFVLAGAQGLVLKDKPPTRRRDSQPWDAYKLDTGSLSGAGQYKVEAVTGGSPDADAAFFDLR